MSSLDHNELKLDKLVLISMKLCALHNAALQYNVLLSLPLITESEFVKNMQLILKTRALEGIAAYRKCIFSGSCYWLTLYLLDLFNWLAPGKFKWNFREVIF